MSEIVIPDSELTKREVIRAEVAKWVNLGLMSINEWGPVRQRLEQLDRDLIQARTEVDGYKAKGKRCYALAAGSQDQVNMLVAEKIELTRRVRNLESSPQSPLKAYFKATNNVSH